MEIGLSMIKIRWIIVMSYKKKDSMDLILTDATVTMIRDLKEAKIIKLKMTNIDHCWNKSFKD